MIFGAVPLHRACGAVLAHSLDVKGMRLRKGTVLSEAQCDALAALGVETLIVARPVPGDVAENPAALRLAQALSGEGLRVAEPVNGRCNLIAEQDGVLQLDAAQINHLNGIDEALTVATLAPFARLRPGTLAATIKVIPYFVAEKTLAQAEAAVRAPLRLVPFAPLRADLLLTRTDALKPSLLDKAEASVRRRLAGLGLGLGQVEIVAHESVAVAQALRGLRGDLLLIFGASATCDRADICPAGLVAAGGALTRFGLPVDPGNLLFTGTFRGRTVIGLPGCARAPALNGADWVLERAAARLPLDAAALGQMGVGGLLKEIPSRPHPRLGKARAPQQPNIAIILLAAGAARRMRGRDKLLEEIDGAPLLRRMAERAAAAHPAQVTVVLDRADGPRAEALAGLDLTRVINPVPEAGMGASIACAMQTLPPKIDGVMILPADMPGIETADLVAVMDAFRPDQGATLVRAVDSSGAPGHPVLFGRRYFEGLAALDGDEGARAVLKSAPRSPVPVPLAGDRARCDLDTPEAWAAWRARQG